MRFELVFFLCLNWLANAAVVPYAANATTDLDTRDGSGYRSVAYFVNWVRNL